LRGTRPKLSEARVRAVCGPRAKRPRTAQRRKPATATHRANGHHPYARHAPKQGGARPRRRKSRAGAPKRTRTARQAGAAARPTATSRARSTARRAGEGGVPPDGLPQGKQGIKNRLAAGRQPPRGYLSTAAGRSR